MKILIVTFCIVIFAGIIYAILSNKSSSGSNKTCNKNEEYVGNACQCIGGYTKDLSGTCIKPVDCKDPNEIYNDATNKCECINGYTRDLSGVCITPPSTDCKDPQQIYNSVTKKCECKDGYYIGPNNKCIPNTFQLINEGSIIGVTDDNQPVIVSFKSNTLSIGDIILKAPLNLQNVDFQYGYGVFKGSKGLVTISFGNNKWGLCDLTKDTCTYDKDSNLNKLAFQGISMIFPNMGDNDDGLAICDPLTETASGVFVKNKNTGSKWTQQNIINDPKFFVTNTAVGGIYQCIFGILDNTICMYKSSDSGNTWNSSPIRLDIKNSINQPDVSSSVILGNDIYIGINYGSVYKMDLTSSKNIPVVLENIPRMMTLWKKIVTYGNVLFFLGNETNYLDTPSYVYISKNNGNTFSDLLKGHMPLASDNLFYKNNTLYVGNSLYTGKKDSQNQNIYIDRVWKATISV